MFRNMPRDSREHDNNGGADSNGNDSYGDENVPHNGYNERCALAVPFALPVLPPSLGATGVMPTDGLVMMKVCLNSLDGLNLTMVCLMICTISHELL